MISPQDHPVHPDYSILTTKYQSTWQGLLQFELISKFGRLFLANRAPSLPQQNLLHLGCGTTYLKGWVNADFFRLLFWKKPQPEWQLDLRFPLKCDNNHWDGVFTEHTFEHLTPASILALFKELHRTMKPGAYLRICVPGLDQSIKPFIDPNDQSENAKEMRMLYGNLATAIWSLTQTWGHYSVWNGEHMVDFLKTAGFSEAQEVAFGEGANHDIIKDNANRKHGSLYVEARK
jgi:predicted SAM-dependent methyltransferase